MTTIQQAACQLGRSERGQMTCKLLVDFLKSPTVQGLDAANSTAVATMVRHFMLGTSADACEVIDSLQEVIHRNQWVMR